MTIAVFFGSFNPIHNGHVAIAEHFLSEPEIDQVWLSVSPQNPWKEASGLMPMVDRVAMTRLAVAHNEKINVIDFEKNLSQPSFTYEALCTLQQLHPQHKFILIIGGDNCESFDKWRNYDKILEQFRVWAYPRDRKEISCLEGIRLVDAPLFHMSSTDVRSQLDDNNVPTNINPDVKAYLKRFNGDNKKL